MPEHLRALVVILVLAATTYALARRPTTELSSDSDFVRRRNLWFFLTLLAFLSHNFWVYTAVAALVLGSSRQAERNPLALFFCLLFLLPSGSVQIPGFGVINYLFALNHLRLIALLLLLPTFFILRRQNNTVAFGRYLADKLLIAYLLLVLALHLRSTSLTDTLRQSFYLFIDVYLPYYVASRSIRNLSGFQDAFASFNLAVLVLSALAIFEFSQKWLLYSALANTLGLIQSDISAYLVRAGSLRASVTTGQPIALGYAVAVALGFHLFLQSKISSKLQQAIVVFFLFGGIIASLSRGPWVGAVIVFSVYLATGRAAIRKGTALILSSILVVSLLSLVPSGKAIIDLLPLIGSTEKENINYRERLIDNALILIERNPWFGSIDYLNSPELEAMRQGQGIIDVVNTYISISLAYGLVGLALFVGFFFSALWGIRMAMRSFRDPDEATARLGRALFATLIGIMVIIFTVSSITIIPIIYWSVAGLAVAYAQLAKEHRRVEREAEMSSQRSR